MCIQGLAHISLRYAVQFSIGRTWLVITFLVHLFFEMRLERPVHRRETDKKDMHFFLPGWPGTICRQVKCEDNYNFKKKDVFVVSRCTYIKFIATTI